MKVNAITRGSTKSTTAARAAVGREDCTAPHRPQYRRGLAGWLLLKDHSRVQPG
ncbi:MAG: hypothetical protein M1438_15120 [Deltaproteobacteria bacterium]|nr:hypothetical protein [Deltaproteobacteria bacterium]